MVSRIPEVRDLYRLFDLYARRHAVPTPEPTTPSWDEGDLLIVDGGELWIDEKGYMYDRELQTLRTSTEREILLIRTTRDHTMLGIQSQVVLGNLCKWEARARAAKPTNVRAEMRYPDAIMRMKEAPRADACRLLAYCVDRQRVIKHIEEEKRAEWTTQSRS